MAEPVTYKLKKPIIFGEETITELQFKPLKFKHLKGVNLEDKIASTLTLASRLSGHPEPVIGEMDIEDVPEVASLISGFLQPSPATGKTPSGS